MRLLDTHTGRFVNVHDPNSVEYAVLSHTWDPIGEQSYHDVLRIHTSLYFKVEAVTVFVCLAIWWRLLLTVSVVLEAPTLLTRLLSRSQNSRIDGVNANIAQRLRQTAEAIRSWNSSKFSPRLSTKIRRACAIARAYGHRLMWIDSCCIDKASSSELSEAINSMYAWYRGATICCAFLADVPSSPSRAALDACSWTSTVAFRKSRWFRRGWTLQELIAPRVVVFLSLEWQFLGTKSSLAQVIEEVTGIYSPVLRHQMPLSEVCVAKRMSWAANRETTRKEDEAYSLLGIFDISMSTLYGEGARAFIRLQKEILEHIPDQSLFAWGVPDRGALSLQFPLSSQDIEENSFVLDAVEDHNTAFFAPSPRSFRNSTGIRPLSHHSALIERLGFDSPLPTYTLTPYGIHTHFPLIPANHCFPPGVLAGALANCYFAILSCELVGEKGSLLAVICSAERTTSGSMLLNGRRISRMTKRRLLHRTTAIHYNRMSEHRIVVFNSIILPELFPLSRRQAVGACSPAFVPIENPLPSSRAWYAWSGSVQLTAWSPTILRQLGYAVSCSMDKDSGAHMLSLARGDTCLSIRYRRSRPKDTNDPFVIVWVALAGCESVQLDERPSVTLDLRRIHDCQEYAVDVVGGRRILLRFTLLYMSISFFLDVEILNDSQTPAPSPASTVTVTMKGDPEMFGTEDSARDGLYWGC